MERDVEPRNEERRRCYWAIVLLCRLLGEPEPGSSTVRAPTPPWPRNLSNAANGLFATVADDDSAGGASSSDGPINIMGVLLRTSEVFVMAQAYVKSCSLPSERETMPWLLDSRYSRTTSAYMNLGCGLPKSHRYRNVNVPKMTKDLLDASRTFCAPWFTSRLVYQAIPCILNHPFLLALQLKDANNATDSFIRQASTTITNHVSWSVHFMQLMRSREFEPSDPVVIYCAAVVATVEIYRSLSSRLDQGRLIAESRNNFDECLRFIALLEHRWVYAKRVVSRLYCHP